MSSPAIQKQGQTTLAKFFNFLDPEVKKEKHVLAAGIDRSAYYRDRKKSLDLIPAGRLDIYVRIFNEHSEEQVTIAQLLNGEAFKNSTVKNHFGLSND